jgi:protein ImuB
VAARLGQAGVNCQRLARGEDPRPLLPAVPEERFEQALDLEWPIEGLEPLSFVLGRLIEPLAAHLDRRGRGAAVLHVRLHLVTRAVHERSLQLPAPMKDARTLRTLALLDLELHPPPAAIDRVIVAVDPTPARVLQFSLLTRPLPSPEQISTLMARLSALMGDGRCGSPVEVDSWQPGAFAMKPFSPGSGIRDQGSARFPVPSPRSPIVALRRFRIPVPVRVRVEQGQPVRVVIDRRGFGGGGVTRCAGPWRTAGHWWSDGAWDRDEWDVTLGDGATYRIFRDRATNAWFLEGVVD